MPWKEEVDGVENQSYHPVKELPVKEKVWRDDFKNIQSAGAFEIWQHREDGYFAIVDTDYVFDYLASEETFTTVEAATTAAWAMSE